MGRLARWWHRFVADADTVDADALAVESAADTEAVLIAACQPGQRVALVGRLRCVDLQPASERPTLTAELFDGTDPIKLIWIGRRAIRGIDPGRTIKVRGRIALLDGDKVMYNPDYQLLPDRT